MLRSRPAALLGALVLVGVIAACGEDAPTPEVDLDADAGAAPSATTATVPGEETAPGAAPEPRRAPDQGDLVDRDYGGMWPLDLPSGGERRVVAQTFLDYMDVRTRAFSTGTLDLAALAAVAAGPPLTDVQSRVAELQDQGLRTVGDAWFRIAARDVRVRGDVADLGACMTNATVDVDAAGTAQESPPDAYRLEVGLFRAGPATWVVDRLAAEALDSPDDC